MNLIEFAKTAKDDVSPEDFVAKMKEILPFLCKSYTMHSPRSG